MSLSVPFLPESAPFSPAQRAWLNGFLAGLMTSRTGAADAAATVQDVPAAPPVPEPAAAEEAFPWHDPALPMDERLTLADGKPPARVLMAAMAQLDCGACGYLCQTYAEAIADGTETDLTKCSPGGRETVKKLRELVPLLVNGKAVAATTTTPAAPVAASVPPGSAASPHDRTNPYPARLLACRRLSAPGSDKDVRHVELGFHDGGLSYRAGDALGVIPENDLDTVARILELLDASGAEDVPGTDARGGGTTSLHEALLRQRTITKPSPAVVALLAATATAPADAEALRAIVDGTDGGAHDGLEVIDLLRRYRTARPLVDRFVDALAPLRPRLYSISSSPAAHVGQVHLTVAAVRYTNGDGRPCHGVASTYFADRLRPGQKVPVFVHPSKFGLPDDASVPVVMIGPGTGIAPFRAFLHERRATAARGRNWLFFGDQRAGTDFLYRDELDAFRADGLLTRLDTAFSRDQTEKVYVQHRMLESAEQLWAWLADGAHLYVCGDAKRMARDVDATLHQIVARQGGMSDDAAREYVRGLTKARRYQRDVY